MADASAISAPKKPAPISAAAPPRSEPVQVQKVEAFADDKVAAPARVNQFNTPQLADAQPAPQPPAAPPAAPLTVPLPATPTPVPTPVPAPAVTLRRNQEEERLAAPLKVQIATTGGTEGAAPIATAGLAANSTAGRLFTLQTQSPSAPAQYFRNVYGGTSPPETDRRATPTRGVLPTPNPTLLKNQSQSQPQSQVSLTGAAQNKVKALNAPGVLANFMIEQSGPEVRFQDQDGSVYVGKLIAAGPDAAPSPRATSTANGGRTRFGRDAARNARAAAPTDQLAVDGFGSVANDTNAVAFEAVGTNATLQQNVRLVGRFYLGDANRTGFQFAGGTTAPAAPAQSLAESAPQLGAQRPALLVLSNAPARLILRVTGQAEFGGTNSIPIDAVPAQP